ncbi:hypothetical protein [uncultured Aureimonas sp.]|uniref:hypothetical protein n=1 Tax=uncultured Aureimonas sp. TaxID=1604662 RepID=UPI0025F400A9|nr:hypothetical protein [uncultured Aureimonas sp.]
MTRTVTHLAIAFLLAVLATAVAASIVQTQINLGRLVELGAAVPTGLRALTTAQDMARFGPVMAAITAAAFLPAFPVAGLVSQTLPQARMPIFALAGAVSLWTAFEVMGVFTPMPTLVAAVRTPEGLMAMTATGLVGGTLFAGLTAVRRRNSPARI